MGEAANQYFIFETAGVFETAGGFWGIAWNGVGIRRFQLPARTAEATERNLLRRLPGAQPGLLRRRCSRPLCREALFRRGADRFFAFPARPR